MKSVLPDRRSSRDRNRRVNDKTCTPGESPGLWTSPGRPAPGHQPFDRPSGGFFNEPKYYDSNRSVAMFYAELLSTGRISSKIVDEIGLTEQARDVLETATAV